MDRLPHELISQVLSNLKPLDRLNSALTCRVWAEAVSASSVLRDVHLVIHDSTLKTLDPALFRNERQYTSLRIENADLTDSHPEFWSRISGTLRKLKLSYCKWTSEVLYSILLQCTRLEWLDVQDCHYAESCPLDLPDNLSIEELRKSLINVRHLGFFVSMTANALDRFLEMMPNLTSLDVNGLFEADLRILLPCFARAPQKFTKLNLKFEFIEDIVLRDLLSLHTNCLQELHILPRGRLALDKAYDVIADCRKLRRLELGDASCLTDAQLDRIVCKAPDLEVLEYAFARHLTEGGLNQMHRLKKLRRLGMAFATGLPTETLCTVGSLSSLRHLDLTEACCDLTVFRSIASLKELRSLEVGSSEFTSECFSIIVEKFVKLEKLHLHESRMLTDEDGVKFCRLQNLKDLKLAQAWGFTDETFEKGLGSPAMERIDLFDCSLTDVGLASLAAKHASLRELVLAKCRKITDAGVASLLRNLPVLRFFDVLGGPSLGVDAIGLLLGDECPRLTSLFVNELSDGVGDLIRGRRPRLHLWEVYSRS